MEWANPIPLATYMSDKAPLWGTMVAKYGLGPIPYDKVASRPFGDFIFDSGFDNISWRVALASIAASTQRTCFASSSISCARGR
jgi:hypothetical protein